MRSGMVCIVAFSRTWSLYSSNSILHILNSLLNNTQCFTWVHHAYPQPGHNTNLTELSAFRVELKPFHSSFPLTSKHIINHFDHPFYTEIACTEVNGHGDFLLFRLWDANLSQDTFLSYEFSTIFKEIHWLYFCFCWFEASCELY